MEILGIFVLEYILSLILGYVNGCILYLLEYILILPLA